MYKVGDYVLTRLHGQEKVAHLISKNDNTFAVKWFLFAKDINSSLKDYSDLNEKELVYLINSGYPKHISFDAITGKCSVSSEIKKMRDENFDNQAALKARYCFDGISGHLRPFSSSNKTDSPAKKPPTGKKKVRVSFIKSPELDSDQDTEDFRQQQQLCASPRILLDRNSSATCDVAAEDTTLPQRRTTPRNKSSLNATPTRNARQSKTTANLTISAILTSLNLSDDSPRIPKTPGTPRTPKTPVTPRTPKNPVTPRTPKNPVTPRTTKSQNRVLENSDDDLAVQVHTPRGRGGPRRDNQNNSSRVASYKIDVERMMNSDSSEEDSLPNSATIDKTSSGRSQGDILRPKNTPQSPMTNSRNPRTPVSQREGLRPKNTPQSPMTNSRTPRTPVSQREGLRQKDTPQSPMTNSRTPRTPVSQREGLRQKDTPQSPMTNSRTPRTPVSLREGLRPKETPQSPITNPSTPRTPVSLREGLRPKDTPQSPMTNSRTPRTPVSQMKGLRQKDTPQSPMSISKTPRTPRQKEELCRTPVSTGQHRLKDKELKPTKEIRQRSEDRGVDSEETQPSASSPPKRSSRACKTAALKAMLAPELGVVVTHFFPAWEATDSRRRLVARRNESPLVRIRRLNTDGTGGTPSRATQGLAGFRRAHGQGDSDDSGSDSSYAPPSASDSDSDWGGAPVGRKRLAPSSGRRTAKKRAISHCSGTGGDEERVALPVRLASAFSEEDEEEERSRSKKPKKKKKATRESVPLEEARLRLHVSNLQQTSGKPLTCRNEEFQDIFRFVSQRLRSGGEEGGCMYISGLPGTGKTATVTSVVAALRSSGLGKFDLIEVNGMRLTDPQQVYVHVMRQLTGRRCTAKHAAQLLDKEFKKKGRSPCLLVVDELDLLCTRKQQVLYNLFDWPQRPSARLTVLAIANTMDLPERLLHQRVASRLGLTRLVFQPYSHQQLHNIVSERLRGLDCFEKEALELSSRKVAAISGDARRALDICRRAAELASSWGVAKVGLKEIDAAIQEMFSSSKVKAIIDCSVYEQLFLRAVLAELVRSGLEEAQLDKCVRQMDLLCRCEGLPLLTGGELFTSVVRLASHKLLLCEHFREDGKMKLRLNCAQHDVTFALKDVKYDKILTS